MMHASDSVSPTFTVVTDSTADIAPAMAAERGITVVPLTVTIGDESFVDGALSQQEFFDRMNAAERLPTTSQPAAGAFAEVYERALETVDQVVSVHISSKLSGTIESAFTAAEQFAGRVHVVRFTESLLGLRLAGRGSRALCCRRAWIRRRPSRA